jgi:hypothetical protein
MAAAVAIDPDPRRPSDHHASAVADRCGIRRRAGGWMRETNVPAADD